jgi:gamma-glutamylcyclotransferase (GGCT)/AIG2-like uncharacterized protein YtfP
VASRLSDHVSGGALDDLLVELDGAGLSRAGDAGSGAPGAAPNAAGSRRVEELGLALERLHQLLAGGGTRWTGTRTAGVRELVERIHAALERPDQKLVAYGTLVPGGVNHNRVAALGGSWLRCFVRGRRWTASDGDPAFRWSPADPEITAMLLVSDQLPSAWPALDRFEGSPYRRRLVPVRVPAAGEDVHHVAYVYESVEQPVSD